MHVGYDHGQAPAILVVPGLPVSASTQELANVDRELGRALGLIGAVLVGLLLFAVGAGIYSAKPFQVNHGAAGSRAPAVAICTPCAAKRPDASMRSF